MLNRECPVFVVVAELMVASSTRPLEALGTDVPWWVPSWLAGFIALLGPVSFVLLGTFLILMFGGLFMVVKRLLAGRHRVYHEDTDLRLTYKRYMELYPNSKITYEEYKKLQAERAYKRAVGSEKLKRMVR